MEVTMQSRARATVGMSLVELMIVVVIIGILAAISVVGYRKYIARARLSEATAMLAEFAAKEQLYFLDNGQYMEVHKTTANYPSTDETSSEFHPQDPGAAFDSVRTPANVYDSSGNMPNSWRKLGVRPRWPQLFCTYLVNAGGANDAPPGTLGPTIWAATPQVPWFYAIAACNLVNTQSAGWPNTAANRYVTTLVLTHDSPQIQTTDENQ
jgi:prepilin-type N-terminal cleavage/methylation domain-containing protein